MITVFHGHNISLGFANTQNRHMPAVFTVTVSGPSPHTSWPLSRSDHARVSVSAFGMYHSIRFGTDHVFVSSCILPSVRSRLLSGSRCILLVSRSPRVLGEPTCILLSLFFALERSRIPTSDQSCAVARSDPRTLTLWFALPNPDPVFFLFSEFSCSRTSRARTTDLPEWTSTRRT